MPDRRQDLETRLIATDDASKVIDKVAGSLDDLEGRKVTVPVEAEVEGQRDVEKFIADLDELDAETKTVVLALEAATVQRELEDIALGIREVAGTDVDITAQIAGANQAQADLERLSTEIKAINDTKISPQVDTSRARGGVNDLADSARGANSAMANMIGNVGQDLGAVAGIAGSAGVAIGQMAEYAADAAFGGEKLSSALKSMVKVAGPIAVLAAAVQAVTGAMADQKAEAEAAKRRTEEFGKAIADAGDDTIGLTKALKDNVGAFRDWNTEALLGTGTLGDVANTLNRLGSNIPILGGLFQDLGVDVVGALDTTGTSIYEFAAAVEGTDADFKKLLETFKIFQEVGLITSDQYLALVDAAESNRKELKKSRQEQKLFNVTQKEANALLQEFVNKKDPLKRFSKEFGVLMNDMRDGTIDTEEAAGAINFLADALGLTQDEIIALAQADLAGELDNSRRMAQELADNIVEVKEAADDAARAQRESAQETRRALEDNRDAWDDNAEAAEAFAEVMEDLNTKSELDFSLKAADTVESFDDLKASLRDLRKETKGGIDWKKIDLSPDSVEELKGMPDELAAVTEAIGQMRGNIQTELADAFETGGMVNFANKAKFFREEVSQQFFEMFQRMGASPEEALQQVHDLLEDLQLLPEQVEVQIKLTRMEEARAALETFAADIDAITDPKLRHEIKLAMASDPEKALLLLNAYFLEHGLAPVVLPTDADPSGAETVFDKIINPDNPRPPVVLHTAVDSGKFYEKMAEIRDGDYSVNVELIPVMPEGLSHIPVDVLVPGISSAAVGLTATTRGATAPTTMSGAALAMPVAVVGAPAEGGTTVNVQLNAAVIGGPFDVMRAVEDQMRRIARLMPVHP